MKQLLALILVVVLTGCVTPVTRHFPNVPDELKVACPDLEQVNTATTKLSDVVTVVTDNYTQYHECRVRVDAWIEWYNTQRTIFGEVK